MVAGAIILMSFTSIAMRTLLNLLRDGSGGAGAGSGAAVPGGSASDPLTHPHYVHGSDPAAAAAMLPLLMALDDAGSAGAARHAAMPACLPACATS